MKRSLNLDLLEFHVREATQELDLLQDAIQYAKDGTAYHHLNFAWNGRFKTMQEADAQFNRNEKFPCPRDSVGWFARFWPKTLIRESKRKSGGGARAYRFGGWI